jgi:hypothetical protein
LSAWGIETQNSENLMLPLVQAVCGLDQGLVSRSEEESRTGGSRRTGTSSTAGKFVALPAPVLLGVGEASALGMQGQQGQRCAPAQAMESHGMRNECTESWGQTGAELGLQVLCLL